MKPLSIIITVLLLIFTMLSCGSFNAMKKNINTKNTLNNTDWKFAWTVEPDKSIDTLALKAHFKAFPERWQAAFNFLKNSNLSLLAVGEYEISGQDVYASVSEYTPKEPVDCNFESHKKYIDLQYVIAGEEKIGIAKLNSVVPITEYDQNKDIIFYRQDAPATYKIATPNVFFVFFPNDAHRPSMKNTGNIKVKKIVIKIKV